ncbi:RecX family transcriptional regulator [Telmatospirillum sp. J64-1]|uniref:RecX family transcriptional regulator n=1 Tax=Telmatospirillum sp. J64-1 TaxID=2502183 RepID=UPI00115CC9E7|nr:RecX family transcriptional regulator [Telmatospirillum sp. J64-1]
MRKIKPPPRITETYLQNAGLHYLQRFASSSENLRRVLMRKVERAAQASEEDAEAIRENGAALIDKLVGRWQEAGLLDDATYAAGRTRSLHRQGDSTRAIRAKLSARGVGADHIEEALEELQEEVEEPDFAAALRFARRRGLGPWRRPDKRDENRRDELRLKDMAALARAGFPHGIARRIADAENPEELEEEEDR